MRCMYCSADDTRVINSRAIQDGSMVWRRRRCDRCQAVFTTRESATADNLFVVKRNGSRQRFVYEKLFVSIFSVINVRKNSDNGDDARLAKKVTGAVLRRLHAISPERSIETRAIIELVCRELRKVDPSYAERYILYSEFRTRVAIAEGIMGRV